MPLVEVRCPNDHTQTVYWHTWEARYQALSRWCACGHPLIPQPSYGVPLLYFRENRPQRIENLGGAVIRSHGEHVRVMKARGVEPATEWHVSRSRSDGLIPRAKKPLPRKGD